MHATLRLAAPWQKLPRSRNITCDIFCRVVDNFGDIGVTWRLARQLAKEFAVDVRLVVDDLASFQKLVPEINLHSDEQQVSGVAIMKWRDNMPLEPGQWVIEAFQCELPPKYLNAMAAKPLNRFGHACTVWLNLEYLSAESWVGGHHLLPSPHPQTGLSKHFFFPGFRADTGGVLRERDLLLERDHFFREHPRIKTLKIFLFGYANAASGGLLQAFASLADRSEMPVICTIPAGGLAQQVELQIEQKIEQQFKQGGAVEGEPSRLKINIHPFCPQSDFDRLLWWHDILFVRGEDSFVRAQWAGKPFIWLIYPQAERAHWRKLNAFLDLYCEDLPATAAVALRELHRAWNDEDNASIGAAFQAFMAQLSHLTVHAKNWSQKLAEMPDLATQLMTFYVKTAKI